MVWPTQSLDLTIIEAVWDKRREQIQLRTNPEDYMKHCVGEFKLCCRMKVVILNIDFQACSICTNSGFFALNAVILCILAHFNKSLH